MSDEKEIYRQQGFGNAVGIGENPALIIVDFVIGFTDPKHFGGGNIGPAIEKTVDLLAFARKKKWPVAHTRVVYQEDGSDAGAFSRKVPSLLKLTPDSELSQIVPELTPQPGELIICKRQASAFFATELAAWLTYRGVDTTLVTGCTTSGCIRATVIDSVSSNFGTVVVTDCVGDRAIEPHEANLFDMGQKYADLVPSTDIYSHAGESRAA
jgi:maleamate amidohydrolase